MVLLDFVESVGGMSFAIGVKTSPKETFGCRYAVWSVNRHHTGTIEGSVGQKKQELYLVSLNEV